MLNEKIDIQILAHNGSRFDNIIMLEHIIGRYGVHAKVLGTLSDVKGVLIADKNMGWFDSINQSQLGSLNNGCGPKGLNLGLRKLDLGEVEHLKSWQDYERHPK
jgi:hypothetical protein